jgi:molecular chaperone GrpE
MATPGKAEADVGAGSPEASALTAEDRVAELDDRWRRAVADLDNLRKRHAAELGRVREAERARLRPGHDRAGCAGDP